MFWSVGSSSVKQRNNWKLRKTEQMMHLAGGYVREDGDKDANDLQVGNIK